MFANRGPDGTVLLTTFAGGRRDPEVAAMSDEAVVRLVLGELAALVGATGTPLFTEVVRWPQAIPQYDLGHLGRIARVEQAETDVPGLLFCANYKGGVSVSDCIKNGRGVAARWPNSSARPRRRRRRPHKSQSPRRAHCRRRCVQARLRPQFQQRSKLPGDSSPHPVQRRAGAATASASIERSITSARSRSHSRSSQTCGCATSGGHVADDRRSVLVEDVRANPRLVEAVGDEVRVVALAGDVEAEHRSTATGATPRLEPVRAGPGGSEASVVRAQVGFGVAQCRSGHGSRERRHGPSAPPPALTRL